MPPHRKASGGPGGHPRRQGGGPGGPQSRPRPRPAARRDDDAPADGSERLQKVLAGAGLGSRRACEEFILQGRVTVNGKVVRELGVKVKPTTDKVAVDGEPIREERTVYYAVYKPKGYVSTNNDPSGRPRVVDLLPEVPERVYTVGRLDEMSTGLILLTNDGELANRLAHPKFGVEKRYRALVAGEPTRETLDKIVEGVWLAEGKARAKSARVVGHKGESTIVEMVLAEGKNREVRRMFAKLGHKVMSLNRVSVGPVTIKGLRPGESRRLTSREIDLLQRVAAGLPVPGMREEPEEDRGPRRPVRGPKRYEPGPSAPGGPPARRGPEGPRPAGGYEGRPPAQGRGPGPGARRPAGPGGPGQRGPGPGGPPRRPYRAEGSGPPAQGGPARRPFRPEGAGPPTQGGPPRRPYRPEGGGPPPRGAVGPRPGPPPSQRQRPPEGIEEHLPPRRNRAGGPGAGGPPPRPTHEQGPPPRRRPPARADRDVEIEVDPLGGPSDAIPPRRRRGGPTPPEPPASRRVLGLTPEGGIEPRRPGPRKRATGGPAGPERPRPRIKPLKRPRRKPGGSEAE